MDDAMREAVAHAADALRAQTEAEEEGTRAFAEAIGLRLPPKPLVIPDELRRVLYV